MTHPIPDEVLASHTAILGKTGSGKTSTEKLCVEQVVGEGFRVCVLDSVKSDWWGITSNAKGDRPGLPFKILGGPHGHVPLHSSAGKVIGQLVGSGKLPLSIIDMADFEPGGLQRFFVDFAPALMRAAKGVVYLVIEEAHEFAPKERAGIGAENLAIHWAKKLATAGRSKGIRLIVATQRIQSLHNAVLGSCETIIAHRLTTPADQGPVINWLKANTDKETQEKVSSSLSSLPTGTAWLCSGEARIFEKVALPKFKTYDNTATPTGDGAEVAVKTAPVDQDELRAIIGDAVKEAEANDPKLLKAEIARLKREAAKPAIISPTTNADPKIIERARTEGYDAGLIEGEKRGEVRGIALGLTKARNALDALRVQEIAAEAPKVARPAPQPKPNPAPVRQPPASSANGALSGPQRQLLRALMWWRAMGHEAPSRPQLAGIAGWKITSGHLKNVIGGLKTSGLVIYPSEGRVSLTPEGLAVAPEPDMSATLHDGIRAALTGPQKQIFEALLAVGGGPRPRGSLAEDCGWEPTSGHLKNVIGSMKTLEIVEYPISGEVALQPWVTGT